MRAWLRFLRHAWLDAGEVAKVLDAQALERLAAQIRSSETQHSGEVCVHIEAGLPVSYLWRHWRDKVNIAQIVHERALSQFARLRVWDTEHNNGVLIYLQLAERQIEIVADRGVAAWVTDAEWASLLEPSQEAFRRGAFEAGLAAAINAVTGVLQRGFPVSGARRNQLPDEPRIE